jgi:hypothetical protein
LGRQYHYFLFPGGQGGPGGSGDAKGGAGGPGEGPTVIFDNSTNKTYVGEVSPFPFPKFFLNNNSVHLGQGLIKFPMLNILQAELCLGSRKFCASGWSLLPIQRTDSMNCGAFITKPLGAGSYVISDSSNGGPCPVLYGSKESVTQFYSVPIPCPIILCSWYREERTKVICIAATYITLICC